MPPNNKLRQSLRKEEGNQINRSIRPEAAQIQTCDTTNPSATSPPLPSGTAPLTSKTSPFLYSALLTHSYGTNDLTSTSAAETVNLPTHNLNRGTTNINHYALTQLLEEEKGREMVPATSAVAEAEFSTSVQRLPASAPVKHSFYSPASHSHNSLSSPSTTSLRTLIHLQPLVSWPAVAPRRALSDLYHVFDSEADGYKFENDQIDII